MIPLSAPADRVDGLPACFAIGGLLRNLNGAGRTNMRAVSHPVRPAVAAFDSLRLPASQIGFEDAQEEAVQAIALSLVTLYLVSSVSVAESLDPCALPTSRRR